MLGVLLLILCGSCAQPTKRVPFPLNRFEFNEPHMGVPFRMVVYAPGATAAQDASRAAFNRVRELNGIMSDYETDSELNLLSQTSGSGRAVKVSPDLWHVLERSQQLAKETQGAFDITVGPCVGLWRKARREGRLPDPERLLEALGRCGYTNLVLDAKSRTAMLRIPDMHLDLGAIAKGYAVDEALRVLRGFGLGTAMVSGGGDMALGDPPPGRDGWQVEIAPLNVPGAPSNRLVSLSTAGLATSGDSFQHLEIGGIRYSHILDPRTGVGLVGHNLVTVIARDGITADSLATAVSVLGPEAGLALIERTPGAAAMFTRRADSTTDRHESRRLRFYLAK